MGASLMKLMVSALALMACLASEAAVAQASMPDDLVVMRRQIAPRKKDILQPPGSTEPSGYYSWQASSWKQTGACGDVVPQTRETWCERTGGTKVADAYCFGNGSGPKPVSEMQAVNTQACEFQWKPGAWQGVVPECGTVTQTRTNACTTKTGQPADASKCAMKPPETTQSVTNYAKCEFTWAAGPWGQLLKYCGDVEQRRDVSCRASDGSTVSAEYCANSGPAPQSTYIYHFPSCKSDGAIDPSSRGWMTSEWTPEPARGCGEFVVSRSVQCVSGTGAVVSDAECQGARPEATKSVEITNSCSYTWQYGPTRPAPQGCGVVNATRTVSCVRTDGEVVSGEICGSDSRPQSIFPSTDYSQCSYKWEAGDWSEWSNTCGQALRTRAVMCMRGDGTAVEDAQCGEARPASSDTSYITTGCGIEWKAGDWVSESSCARSAHQTRSVVCTRSDGEVLPDASCTANKPGTEKVEDNFSGCSYTWAAGEYGEPTTTCGTATVSRAVSCQRSDGERVPDDQCGSAGAKPEASYQVEMATSCTYKWESGEWGNPVAACGVSTHSRVNTCKRSDEKTVDASFCTTAEPSRTGPVDDFTNCTYKWHVSAWNSDGSCGDSAVQTRTVSCQRSEGTMVEAKFCTEPKPAGTQTVTDYTGCKYEWKSTQGQWSSQCSTTATRNNIVSCERSDGTAVGDDYCPAGTKPPVTETQENLSQCTFSGAYDNWTVCRADTPGSLAGKQTGTLVSCRRSDNTVATNDKCEPTQVRNCAVDADRYLREPFEVYDSSEMPQAVRQYNTPNAAKMKFTVTSTTCWDRQANATTSNSNCANLPTGANVYDVIEIPATFLPELREVYVNQADLTSMVPHGRAFGFTVENVCSNPGRGYSRVQEGSSINVYGLSCGVPDTPSNYARTASQMGDPYNYSLSRDRNSNANATNLALIVESTICRDVTKNVNATASKCSYLPTGANIYDIVTVPATFVSDLREIYINVADIRASMPYGGSVGGANILDNSLCTRNWTVRVGANNWYVRCGTPDSAQNYQRAASALVDPAGYSSAGADRYGNVDTQNVLGLHVTSTVCRNITTNTNTDASKCAYIPGVNVYDVIKVPATYVPGLREVYVNQADLTAAIPYGGNVFDVGIASLCQGNRIVNIGTGGVRNNWLLKCGTPDTAENYSREIYSISDPKAYTSGTAEYRNVNENPASTNFRFRISATACIDKRTNTTAPSAKCSYLPSGVNVNDVLDMPITKVEGLREFYLQREDLQTRAPYLTTVEQLSGSSNNIAAAGICNGAMRYNVQGNFWRMMCGQPDSELNYERRISTLNDPYKDTAKTIAYRSVNTISAGRLTLAVDNFGCYDKRTNALSTDSAKCANIPGYAIGDVIDVAATYVEGLREVYFDKQELLQKAPNLSVFYSYGSNASPTTMCNGTPIINVGYSGGRANFKAYCDRAPDNAEHYARVTAIFGDPYTYFSSSRLQNSSTSGSFTYTSASLACYDTDTGQVVSAKCDYLSGPNRYDRYTVPAVWDVTAKTITVSLAAIKAQHSQYTPENAYTSQMCNTSFTTNIGGAKVICQP